MNDLERAELDRNLLRITKLLEEILQSLHALQREKG